MLAGTKGKSKKRVIRCHQSGSLKRRYSTTKKGEVVRQLGDPSIYLNGSRILTHMTGQFLWAGSQLFYYLEVSLM